MKDFLEKTQDIVFSLDIGTRTIIGLVGRYEDGILNIIASEVLCHEKRAMFDGQIHDINSVVRVAGKVKESLENQIGFTLDKVAIAAAGRSLEVSKATVTLKIDNTREIDRSTIKSSELEAVQEAERSLKEKRKREEVEEKKYYCVGHTVVRYYLDDILIENLEGHKGDNISIEVVATFLPHTVVDSLNTVMNRLDLEVINMTLEPIAAINVAVKKNLRLLNIALVDIGAGTSDIAITKEGTISCYAMAPVAGDEITETLVKKYLLDYDIAEKLKINLKNSEEHEFQDIIGMNYKLTRDEILDRIDESIRALADEISERIIGLNEGSPSVVFLIGGGSQIPRLNKYISEKLQIPEERVAIKDTSLLENVIGINEKISGPDAITPVGIAMMALENNYKDFLEISLNGEKLRLFNSENSKITDVLLLNGFNPRNLLSKRGKAIKYYLNGVEKNLLGQVGEPAKIYLNGVISSLESKLKDKDEIVIEDATIGEDACSNLFDIIDKSGSIYLDRDEYNMIVKVSVNGEEITDDREIRPEDKVEILQIDSLYSLCKHLNIDKKKISILKDEKEISQEYLLKSGDRLTTVTRIEEVEASSDRDYVEKEDLQSSLTDNFVNYDINSSKKTIELSINGEKRYIDYNKDKFKFVDVFDHIDFDLNKVNGNLILKINNENAEYLQCLKNGDILQIYWEN